MSIQEFAPQEVWDEEYKGIRENLDQFIDENDKVALWLNDFLKTQDGKGKEVFEIGCFPGRYLYHFGKKGYVLNGIDITKEMDDSFIQWLRNKNFNVGEITKEDVFNFKPSKQYDIVSSFGFIEHFANFDALIEQHIQWTKPNGYIIISVPDFSNPVQYTLHKLSDKKLLSIHNLKAMNINSWKEVVKRYKVEIIFEGHFGGYSFWAGTQNRNLFQKLILKVGYASNNVLTKKIKRSSSFYSPFMGMIFKKLA